MKAIQETIKLLFVSVVGSLLFFFLQNHFNDIRDRQGITARAIAGPSVPIVSEKDGQVFDLSASDQELESNNGVAKLEIQNTSKKTLAKSRLVFTDSYRHPDVIIFDSKTDKAVSHLAVKSLDLPTIQPGEHLIVYLRSSIGFGWPEFFNDVHLYSEYGEIPLSLLSHKTKDGYGDEDQGSSFMDFILRFWYLIVAGLSLFLCLFYFIGDHLFRAYYRKLLLDEDFWFAERDRIEKLGREKFIPNTKDLSLPDV